MSKDNKKIFQILKERKVEAQLKGFFNRSIQQLGEDYTALFFSSDQSLTTSLSYFTSKFDNLSNTELVFALLKSAVLTRDTHNYAVSRVVDLISEGNIEDAMNLVYQNLSVRKKLTRVFALDSGASNYELFQKSPDVNALGNFLSLLYFQEELRMRKNQNKKTI